MSMETVNIGDLKVSRLIIGGNPFSGFSHQGTGRDLEMKRYYTTARIKDELRKAESLGVTAHVSRADHHVMRYLLEYWDEGGKVTWMAQTCPELGDIRRGVANAIAGGAGACQVHGGTMDFSVINGRTDEVRDAIKQIRDAGLQAGIAGHDPRVFRWAHDHLDVDYYMCSYYNSAHRDKRAEHVSGMPEWFLEEDRLAMTQLIEKLTKPVIHYKVFAAGRNDPKAALDFAAKAMRDGDAVCVGVFSKGRDDMLAEDVRLLEDALARAAGGD